MNVIIETIKRIFLWLYSVVVRATISQIIHESIISMLATVVIILSDKLGWKNRSIQNSIKKSPFIQKNDLIFNIFNKLKVKHYICL